MTQEALVSIGLPVFNGEEFLRQALESLLAQDYRHFELIISDNASTDRTESICCEFRSRDPRIRYVRHTENRGAPWNFAFALAQARGDYFMWAAHDDLWHTSYIRKCLAALESNSEAVLCCTEVNIVDRHGRPSIHYPNYKNIDTLGMSPVERIHELMSVTGWFATYGLMRRKMIPPVPSGDRLFGWDVVHLLQLSLLGTFGKVPDPLFTFRILDESKTAEQYNEVFNSPLPAPTAPYSMLLARLMETVYRSSLSPSEKTQVYADFIISCQKSPWRVQIAEELLGPNAVLDDARFALLLGMVLNNAVPFEGLKHNPLAAAVYRCMREKPDLICQAKELLQSHSEPRERKFVCTAAICDTRYTEESADRFDQNRPEHETSMWWCDWATRQLDRGHVGEAEEGLRRSIVLDRANSLAALKLGIILAKTGRFAEAIPCLEQGIAIATDGDRSSIETLLGECHRKSLTRERQPVASS